MRDIKFRAWHKDEKIMYPHVLVTTTCGVVTGNLWHDGEEENAWKVWAISFFIPMQYTGLKDKDGIEIYEGDLLNWTAGNQILEVRWGSVGWVLFGRLFARHGFPNGDDCNEINTKGYTNHSKVIGNIYENPELSVPEKGKI